MNLIEQIKEHDRIMEIYVGKEKWESLTPWEKMIEIAYLKEAFYKLENKKINDGFFKIF